MESAKLFEFCLFIVFGAVSSTVGYYIKGIPSSYAKYPSWVPCMNGSIEMEFKTAYPNGLLMYIDDRGSKDFFEMKLLRGSVHLIFSLGGEKMRLQGERFLNDSQWHKVSIRRSGRNITLTVDNVPVTRAYHYHDQIFGTDGANSPLYIGGIPSIFLTQKDRLTLDSVVTEAHFDGSVRNLLVSDCGKPKKRPQLQEYRGIQDDGTDQCSDSNTNPCLNGGICLTRDVGVECDCSYIQFEGQFCEKGRFIRLMHKPENYKCIVSF